MGKFFGTGKGRRPGETTRHSRARALTTDDYWAWLSDLFVLLDRIDLENDNPAIEELLKQRFQIAEKYGCTVTFGEETSGDYH